jgi:hypothetical protein
LSDQVLTFANKKLNGHERQRYHALLLVTKGYTYRQIADILFADEETISRGVRLYQEQGLEGLKNHPRWGGEHGQCRLSERGSCTGSMRINWIALSVVDKAL